jgi:hypothetical protein
MLCKAHAAGHEALRLGVILAVDVAHQFTHDVLVIPGRAERVLGDHPALAEQHEIDVCGSRLPEGAVSTVKIDGSGWSNRIAPTGQ